MKILKVLISFAIAAMVGCTSAETRKTAATDPSESLMFAESKQGKIVAVNYHDLHYFMRVNTKDLQWQKPTDNAFLIKIDGGRIIKVMNLQFDSLKKNPDKYTGKQILMNYNAMELKSHVDKFGKDVKYTGKYFEYRSTPSIYWTLDLPAQNGKPSEKYQFFSVLKNKKDVITIGTMADAIDENKSKMVLMEIIVTLSTYPQKITRENLNLIVMIINNKK